MFGDNAIETGIPSEVWRYYLLVNRPETADTVFTWDDFAAKNNAELLNCLGNLVNRALSFVARKLGNKLPAKGDELSPLQVETAAKVNALIAEYFELMEGVHIKDALKAAIAIARIGNEYIQAAQPWTLLATDPLACGTALHFRCGRCLLASSQSMAAKQQPIIGHYYRSSDQKVSALCLLFSMFSSINDTMGVSHHLLFAPHNQLVFVARPPSAACTCCASCARCCSPSSARAARSRGWAAAAGSSTSAGRSRSRRCR